MVSGQTTGKLLGKSNETFNFAKYLFLSDIGVSLNSEFLDNKYNFDSMINDSLIIAAFSL